MSEDELEEERSETEDLATLSGLHRSALTVPSLSGAEARAPSLSEQKLVQVGPKERFQYQLARQANEYRRRHYTQEQLRRQGPGACVHCGSDSCGMLWSAPGSPESEGERCCERCTHTPAPGWVHTHTAWAGPLPYPVCAVKVQPGDVLYLRRDGVIEFVEMAASERVEGERPKVSVAFQGRPQKSLSLTLAGDDDPYATDLWEGSRPLDEHWITIRSAEARGLDEGRKVAIEFEVAEREAELDRLEKEQQERDRLRREADNAARQLRHETVTVLREMAEVDETRAAQEASGDVPTLGAKKTLVSKIMKDRKKRAEAKRAALQRLEQKRKERLARYRGEPVEGENVVAEES